MNNPSSDSPASSSLLTPHPPLPSAFRAWCVLVIQSFQRHWRVRQMGWVSLGLLGLVVFWVALITQRDGWNIANQRARRSANSYQQEADRLLEAPPVARERSLLLGFTPLGRRPPRKSARPQREV